MASTQLDNRVEVVAPENILFHYAAAGPFRRLPAYLIDVTIRIAIMVLLGIVSTMLAILFETTLGMGEQVGMISQGVIAVVWLMSQWFYGGLFETFMNGQTPGKRLMGLRVLTTDGEPIDALQAIGRHFILSIDFMPWIPASFTMQMLKQVLDLPIEVEPMHGLQNLIPTFFLGGVMMMFTKKYQRIGDWVCDTMVVVESREQRFDLVKMDDQRTLQLANAIPASFDVSHSLARALSLYVDRRRMFSPRRREELARWLAGPLIELFRLPADTSGDLLLCALYFRTFYHEELSDQPPVIADSPNVLVITE